MRPNDFGSHSCAAAQRVAVYRRLHNLDLIWLRDESLEDVEKLPASESIARETVEDLTAALTESGALPAGLEEAVNAS